METGDIGRKLAVEDKGGRNLYITRPCADIWKGMRHLVYELIILSFSLSHSLSLSLSLPHCAVRHYFIRSRPPFVILLGLTLKREQAKLRLRLC